jgi:hypothetical protein
MFSKVDRSGDAAAVAAFLSQGGEVQKVEENTSGFEADAARIAADAGMTERGERRLLRQLKTGWLTVEEAEEKYLPEGVSYDAEQAAEIRMETFVGARLYGASVSDALDDANYAANRKRRR